MCVLRALDKKKYGDFSRRAVWCAFLKFRFPKGRVSLIMTIFHCATIHEMNPQKEYSGKYKLYCKSKESEPWPATFREDRAARKAEEERKRKEKIKRLEKKEKEEEKLMQKSLEDEPSEL